LDTKIIKGDIIQCEGIILDTWFKCMKPGLNL